MFVTSESSANTAKLHKIKSTGNCFNIIRLILDRWQYSLEILSQQVKAVEKSHISRSTHLRVSFCRQIVYTTTQ